MTCGSGPLVLYSFAVGLSERPGLLKEAFLSASERAGTDGTLS